ncbi:FkbM family methyltransferase [Enterobacterales bacterium CwR94]|nr:FkbM family methyltransferase [Enterobacterales bacterium CwR94]
MIVNRHDYNQNQRRGHFYGVGFQLLNTASFDPDEVQTLLKVLNCRRKYYGDGVFAIDGGANIGVHTLEWARHMHGWGNVLSFEAQERIFYALAGNVALNNCSNAQVKLCALGRENGEISVPQPDYFTQNASFGSLELRPSEKNEFIGQNISYSEEKCLKVPVASLDSMTFPRVDLIKLDIEGMELEVLEGGEMQLKKHCPVVFYESQKGDKNKIKLFLNSLDYNVFQIGYNSLAVHKDDPLMGHL